MQNLFCRLDKWHICVHTCILGKFLHTFYTFNFWLLMEVQWKNRIKYCFQSVSSNKYIFSNYYLSVKIKTNSKDLIFNQILSLRCFIFPLIIIHVVLHHMRASMLLCFGFAPVHPSERMDCVLCWMMIFLPCHLQKWWKSLSFPPWP